MFPLPFIWIKVILGAALFAAGFGVGYKLTDNRWQGKWDAEQAASMARSLQASEEARKRERELLLQIDNARSAYEDAMVQIKEWDARIIRLRVDRDRLHNDLVSFAAGSPAADTIAACQDRAGRLATLLAEGADLVERNHNLAREAAFAAEVRGSKLVSCLGSWPQ